MTTVAIIALVVLVVVALLASQRGKAGDISIPSAPQRHDLLFGYYGCYGNQVAETAGHTNLLWETFWNGIDGAITNLRAANCASCIDLANFILSIGDTPRTMQPHAEAQVRSLFDRLRAAGVLHLVRFIVPSDEPNLRKDGTIDLMPTAVALIRRVVADYPELAGCKLGVVYATARYNPMEHIELFDVVGFDDYDQKSGIFSPGGMYAQMKAMLRPDQQTWILPGACYGQDPAPFLSFANGHDEVLAIVPFLWSSVPWESSFKGIVDQPEMRSTYEALGATIVKLVRLAQTKGAA